jgi:hypothetical protein
LRSLARASSRRFSAWKKGGGGAVIEQLIAIGKRVCVAVRVEGSNDVGWHTEGG